METDFVLLPKIIAYAVFQLSLSYWFVFTETVDRILKPVGSIMYYYKLMKSNHEYQIMKYFSATLCQNLVPQNKME